MTYEELEAENSELHEKIAEMQSDIIVTVETITGAMHAFGLKKEDFKNGTGDIMAKLPMLLPAIMGKLATGGLDKGAMDRMSALSPVMEKYQYLVSDIISD